MPLPPLLGANDRLAILVAEHEPAVRDQLVTRLGSVSDSISVADESDAVWTLLLKKTFDLAFINLAMSGLNSPRLLATARTQPRTKHLPIVAVIAEDSPITVEYALAAGATSFLTKPVAWPVFECSIAQLLHFAAIDRRARAKIQLGKVIAREKDAMLADLGQEISETTARLRSNLQTIVAGNPFAGLRLDAGAAHGETAARGLSEVGRLEVLRRSVDHWTRILADEVMVADTKVDLGAIVAGALADVEAERSASDISMEIALPLEPVILRCHADALRNALRHLLRNAVAHSPSGGSVRLSAEIHEDGLLSVDVTDAGEGMHPDFVAHVLGHRSPSPSTGRRPVLSGFGLRLAKAIAEAHDGVIEIRSMSGEGTSAMIALPPSRVFETISAAA